MWRDYDPPALVDTHAQQTPVHPCDESAQADLADESFVSIIAAEAVMGMRMRVKNSVNKIKMGCDFFIFFFCKGMECKGGMPFTNCLKLTRVDTKSIIAVIFSAFSASPLLKLRCYWHVCSHHCCSKHTWKKSIKGKNKMRVSFLYFCAYCKNYFTVLAVPLLHIEPF